jgi:hypothetical protein
MGVYRSYFSKNNTLVGGSLINSAKNPVTDISYGGLNGKPSRFIFDIDYKGLVGRINDGIIEPKTIKKHYLRMQNTIRFSPEYIGKDGYSSNFKRANQFTLNLFNVTEDWTEGVGYDLNFENQFSKNQNNNPSNWTFRFNDVPWSEEGVIGLSGDTLYTVGSQYLNDGSEDIFIDVTEYINQRLSSFGINNLSVDGTQYNDSFGLGLKFDDTTESINSDLYRFMVSFHTKYTNTFYEPFIETIYDNTITDDRNYFFLDKDNKLYLYPTSGGQSVVGGDYTVESVTIKDYNDIVVGELSGDSIQHNGMGVYNVEVNVDSLDYPDAVIFEDHWKVKTSDNKIVVIEDQFYLVDLKRYYSFNESKDIEFGNYGFYFWGLNYNENVVAGDIRKIKFVVKELYATPNNFTPLNIQYRLFTKVGDKYEIDVIPYTSANRTRNTYNCVLDTSWLIPQDYYLQVRMVNAFKSETKETLRFSVVSNKIK